MPESSQRYGHTQLKGMKPETLSPLQVSTTIMKVIGDLNALVHFKFQKRLEK